MVSRKLLLIPSIALLGVMYNGIVVKGATIGESVSPINKPKVTLNDVYNNPLLRSFYGVRALADELNPVWFDVTIAGIVPINNTTEMDYKLSSEELKAIYDKYKFVAQHVELMNGNDDIPLTEDSITNYLKEKGIISTDVDITFDGLRVQSSMSKMYNYTDSTTIGATDFLMALGKTVYGVKDSRTILLRSKSVRNGTVMTSSTSDKYIPVGFESYNFITSELGVGEIAKFNYYFNYGDINVYKTSNIPELYLKDLVKDGVVSLTEISNKNFINYYYEIGKAETKPSWDPSNGVIDLNNNLDVDCLGDRFTIEEIGNNILIGPNDSTYLINENINTIDALVYLEKAMRFNEKNLTKLESDIVTYKYGVDYVSRIPSEYQDTIKFLIAKGIINFEDETEFKDLFKPLTYKRMKQYLYRLHNTNARFDFSKIQLTDSDNYLLSKGLGETKIDIFEGDSPYFDTTVISEVASGIAPVDYGIMLTDTISARDGIDSRKFKVKRVFDTASYKFFYKGIELKEGTEVKDDIKSVSYNKDANKLTVEFEIESTSSVSAVAIIDANMVTESKKNNVMSVGTVDALAYVSDPRSKEESTFISQTSIRNLPNMPLLVVNDKYIVNKQTGAKALLLNDNKKALIGNHVINFEETMVKNLAGEIYYNLAVLKTIMSESMLSSLDPSELFVTAGFSNNEYVIDLVNSSNSVVDSMYIRYLRSKVPGSSDPSGTTTTNKWFLNISQANALSNYVIYDLKKDLGSEDDIKMVLEFNYVLPDKSELGVDQSFIDKFNSGGLSVTDVYDFAYKVPENETLRAWWNSNLTFSNCLMNYIMGTSNMTYISSGYLMPKITVLGDLSAKASDGNTYFAKLNQLFVNGIGLPSTFVSETLKNSNNAVNFINSYFNFQGNFYVSTGNPTLDSLIYKRNFVYIKGDQGKYYDGGTNSYKDSNYMDYGDYVVLGVNDNVYLVPSAISYLAPFNTGDKTVMLKNVPGVLYQPVESILVGGYYTTSGKIDGRGNCTVYSYNSNVTSDFVCMTEPYKMYSNGEGLYSTKQYDIDLRSTLEDLSESMFGSKYGDAASISSDEYDQSHLPPGVELKKGYYFFNGKYYNIEKDGDTPSDKNQVELKDTKNKEVYVFPAFKLSKVLFKADKISGELVKCNNDPRINIRNVSNVGIVSNVIDSVVYANSDYLTISGIPDGAKVVIGTNVFVKQKGLLQSENVGGSNVIALSGMPIEGTTLPSQFRTIIETHIGNIPMISSANGSVLGQFKDYITSYNFGTGQKDADTKGVLRIGDKGYLVVKNGLFSDRYREGMPFTEFCYAIKVSNDLRFRKVGDGNRYILVNVATDSKDINVSDTSYFTEELDLPDSLNSTVGLTPSEFKESANLGSFVQELLAAYDSQRIEDFTGLVAYILRMLAMLLTATNLIVTVIRSPALDSIVYDIKYKKPKTYSKLSNRKEFEIDLYSIFTLGLQSVDTEKSLLRGIVVSGCLAGVTVFLTMMYFKGF